MTVVPTLGNTLGAIFVGNIFVACLYGLTTLQAYIYYGRCKDDSALLKAVVAALWILDTLHLILTSHVVYTYSITHFGHPIALTRIAWSVVAHILVTAMSDAIVRAVFCYRIWILSEGNLVLFLTNATASILLLVEEIALIVRYFGTPTYVAAQGMEWLLYLTLTTGVIADMLIASTLTRMLIRSWRYFRKMRTTVREVTFYVVSTGTLTSACMLACLIAYAVAPQTLLAIAFFFPMSKLLLNSLLATLNWRSVLRDRISSTSVPMLAL